MNAKTSSYILLSPNSIFMQYRLIGGAFWLVLFAVLLTSTPSIAIANNQNTALTNPTGDFSGDGNVNIVDVDELEQFYGQDPVANAKYDLDCNGGINVEDRNLLITKYVDNPNSTLGNGKGTCVGDLDLDGDIDIVNSWVPFVPGDLMIAYRWLGHYGPGVGYSCGDLNGDGDVDVSEINLVSGRPVNVGDISMWLESFPAPVCP